MNTLTRKLQSVPCPKCGAKAGEACILAGTPGATVLWCHAERWRARPIGEVNHLGGSKIAHRLGRTPSSSCKHGTHKLCSGKLKMNHGYTPACTCTCHKKKAKIKLAFI